MSYQNFIITPISKFAASLDRKDVEKEIRKAQRELAKVRAEYDSAKKSLESSQKRVDISSEKMGIIRKTLVDLNMALVNMDLTGASAIRQENDGDYSYSLDGRRVHIDSSDLNDIKIESYRDYISSKKKEKDEENIADKIVDELNESLDPVESMGDDEKTSLHEQIYGDLEFMNENAPFYDAYFDE